MMGEGNRPCRKLDEEVTIPNSGRNSIQGIISFAKARYFFHVWGVGECAVELVCPRVVGALYTSGKLAGVIIAKQRAAVTADIVKSADAALLVAQDDDAGIRNLADEVIAGLRNLLRSSSAQRHVEVDAFRLTLKPSGVDVVALRQRGRVGEGDFGTRV